MTILDLVKKEGDRKEWIYTCENGIEFKCCIRRVLSSGYLCGYVYLTQDNDYFGHEYNDIPVECHGGLTYGSYDGDRFVIGFDCAHYGDYHPFTQEMNYYSGTEDQYKDMEFVQKECEFICDQLSTKSKSHYRTSRLNQII